MEVYFGIWSICKPYDTLLLKFWSAEHVSTLEDSLRGLREPEIASALIPNRRNDEYYRIDVLHEIFKIFREKPNICDKYRFCQDVSRHSLGLACVTASSIRKRLLNNFEERLGILISPSFQLEVILHSKYNAKRENLGVLIFDCIRNENAIYNHVMQVLHENFYLYTTPPIENDRKIIDETVKFILRQIARNIDCMILFVDQSTNDKWNNRDSCFREILQTSLCWDYKIRFVIISLNSQSDETAIAIYNSFIKLKPVVVMYHKLEMAPSGGLCSIIKKSCDLHFKRAFLKYWFRGWDMCLQ